MGYYNQGQTQERRWFPCDACGKDVTWAQTREGKYYLATEKVWEGNDDHYGYNTRTYYPAHKCTATEEQKAEAAVKREAAKAERAKAKAEREAAEQAYKDYKAAQFTDAGTKFEFEGEVTFLKEAPSGYGYNGVTTTIAFTAEGQDYVWYASGSRMTGNEELEVGDIIKIKGTVKRQAENLRIVVTRCKILNVQKKEERE